MSNGETTLSGQITGGLMDYAIKTINNADAKAAAKTAAKVRKKNPKLDVDELADILIKRKCYRTGAVGAITSGVSVLPGIGSVVALLVTGIGAGSQQLAVRGGEKIAQKATEQLASQAAAKAIPFIGVGVSAGTNILTTYVIGQRAKVGGVVVAGQKSGELVLVTANQTSQGVTALVGTLGGAASYASQFMIDAGKWTGDAVASSGQSLVEISGDVADSVAGSVTGTVNDATDAAKSTLGGITKRLWGSGEEDDSE